MSTKAIEAKGLAKAVQNRAHPCRGVEAHRFRLRQGPGHDGHGSVGLGQVYADWWALSGLLRPDEGSVTALGQNLWSKGSSEIDLLPPRPLRVHLLQGFNLFPALTALQHGRDGFEVQRPHAGKGVRERSRIALEEVGLGKRMNQRPDSLSGGEKQRVAIGRAISKRPATAVRRRTDLGPRRRERTANGRPSLAACRHRSATAPSGHLRHP